MKYRDIVENSQKVYKVECSFFSTPIYFYLWDSIIAFMKSAIGFDYKIITVDCKEIPGNAAMYVAKDLEEDTCNMVLDRNSTYELLHYNELISRLQMYNN